MFFFFFLLFLFFLFRHLELVACFYLNIVSELSLLTVTLAEPPAAGDPGSACAVDRHPKLDWDFASLCANPRDLGLLDGAS